MDENMKDVLDSEENIDLDPALKSACEDDVRNFCSEVTKGNAKVIECLRQQPKLSPKCHKMIFKREKDDLAVVDYTLQKACKRMIKMYCDSINDPVKILPCLRNFKSKPEFDPTCRKVVVQRQVIQNKDYRINPSLQKSCYRDIPKFCSDVLKEHNEEDEFEGKVINCLKKEFVKRRLSTECANEIHMVMKEAAADYRQDPVLAVACRQEISQHCSKELEEVNNDEAAGKGLVEECLKNRFHDKVLKNVKCIKEVARLVQEGHVDINVDPELHRTCNKDLSRHCPDIEPGEGRLMSCLLVQLEDKPQRLQPECRKMLQGRKDMWEYAAQVAPVQGFSELVDQITISPSRNYILGILVSIVGIIFIMGITCGRVTKKVTREMKNR